MPLPSSTVTVSGTAPTCIGAVHGVWRSAGFANVPVGALQRYRSVSPSGSCASAEAVSWRPTSTVQGSQRAFTVGGRLAGAGGVIGAVGCTVTVGAYERMPLG